MSGKHCWICWDQLHLPTQQKSLYFTWRCLSPPSPRGSPGIIKRIRLRRSLRWRRSRLHKETSGNWGGHLSAHGALMQLLTAVALPADHMTTGNQDHSGAVLVADGAVCPGATIGSVRTPRTFHSRPSVQSSWRDEGLEGCQTRQPAR